MANDAIVITASLPFYFVTSFLRANCTTLFGTTHDIQGGETRPPDKASRSQGSTSQAGLPVGLVMGSAKGDDAAAPEAEKDAQRP